MLRSLYLSLIYGIFLCVGLVVPFVMGLGYVWVDTFSPQRIAYSILTDIPVSAIMGAGAIAAYLVMDRRAPPRPTLIMVLILAMGAWVTFTTANLAVAPELAWFKWNWAFKTVMFAAFMPFLFRSRIQIEALLQVYIFAAAIQIVPYGAKTILSGGSYHANLGLLTGNMGLAEGSTLSTVAIMTVPLVIWLTRHSLIIPKMRATNLMYYGLAAMAVSASVGTQERTGLVAIAVLGVGLWLQSKYKLRYAVLGALGLALVALLVIRPDSDWAGRMATITDSHETSSYGRILVWQWTLNFVKTHPFGGGFYAFVVDTITFPSDDGATPVVIHGKAFHSIYFEVLGEHGWVGLGLLLSLLAASFTTLYRVRRKCRIMDGMEWCRELATALMISLTIVIICGLFIGIAFQPEVYYVFALTTMLSEYVRRAQKVSSAMPGRARHADEPMVGEPVFG